MKKPTVSVIIPAYNHERFVGAALESVLSQSMGDLEVVVVDDGSTDRTGEIVKGYPDPRIRYFYQENQDAFNALNRGLKEASGEFVAILNSDDVYASNRLDRLLDVHRRTGCACAFTDVQPINDKGEDIRDPAFGWNQWHRKNRDFYFKCGDLYTAFLKGNFMVSTSNLFLTAEARRKVGEFCSLRYLHDYDYIFRVLLAFPNGVKYLHDEKLLSYRIHGGNTLSDAAIKGREQDQTVIRKYMLARVPEGLHSIVSAGTDRLIELENELRDVKAGLHGAPEPDIRRQVLALLVSVRRKIGRGSRGRRRGGRE